MEISRETMKAVISAIKDGIASVVEASSGSSKLSKLTPGTEVTTEVLERQNNGRFLVRVSGELLDMPLPVNTKVGMTLKMTYVGDQPRMTFAVSSQYIKGSDVNISSAGRWLGTMTSTHLEPSGAEKSANLSSARVFDTLPADTGALAGKLREIVTRSGIFYESHLERWTNGKYPLEELLKEPQGQKSPALQLSVPAQPLTDQIPTGKGTAGLQPPPDQEPKDAALQKQPPESGPLTRTTSQNRPAEGAVQVFRTAAIVSSAANPGQSDNPAGSMKETVPASGTSPESRMQKSQFPADGTGPIPQHDGNGSPLPTELPAEKGGKPLPPQRTTSSVGLRENSPDATVTSASTHQQQAEPSAIPGDRSRTVQEPGDKTSKGELPAKSGSDPQLNAPPSSGEKQLATPALQSKTVETAHRGAAPTQSQPASSETPPALMQTRQEAAASLPANTAISSESGGARRTVVAQPPLQAQGDKAPLLQTDSVPSKTHVVSQNDNQTASRPLQPVSPENLKADTLINLPREVQAQIPRQGPLQFEPPDSQILPVIRQQLEILNTGQFIWQGEAWQGQRMEWAIRRDEKQKRPDAERSWQTDLRIELPKLGAIAASISVSGTRVRLSFSASDSNCTEMMDKHRHRLIEAMESGGLTLTGMEVKHEPSS